MGKQNRYGVILLLAAFSAGCADPGRRFAKLAEEFVYTSLSFSPVSATAAGLHRYRNQNLDTMLDDFSPAAIDQQRQFYIRFHDRLQSDVNAAKLGAQDRADYDSVQDQLVLDILELDHIKNYLFNPTLYVETLGNALFAPYTLEYAPKPQRIRDLIARLQKFPLFVDQAKNNLMASPDIWSKVAIQENRGNIELVDKTIRASVPDELRDAYAKAARPALDALQDFQTYLEKNLSIRNDHNWRLGRDIYTRKFRATLESGLDPDRVLELAETELPQVRTHMMELALPLHKQYYPSHNEHANLTRPEQQNAVISEVLARIAERHATPETYMDDARRDLEEARQFVQVKHLVTLPAGGNLKVIPTPEFMRGIYSVGGFDPAPPLEPQLGAFYWVTPIPADWPKERIESKLREYNFYKLKLLTIHEAMPGHYVQAQFANGVQPPFRRLLRALYGNGAYVEGWAQYATQMMLDQGFDNSPQMQLTFLKEQLRVLANAIIDIRLQMLDMTDQDALDLMEKQTFQEAEEATGKLQRAKLSSAQLPTYFVGWRGWLDARDRYKQSQGAAYSLTGFNDAALKQGAVPLPVLDQLIAAGKQQK